jgi:surface antigen
MKYIIQLFALLTVYGCAMTSEQPAELPALSSTVQMKRFAALQYALEHNVSGHVTVWEVSPASCGSVSPLETVFSGTYGWCRDYEEVIVDERQHYLLVGIACRNPGSRWLVLDVRPFVETVAPH